VGEVLARIAGGQGLRPQDLALFKGDAYSQRRAELGKLDKLVKQQPFRVELMRVACPARGTLLASRRLDAYLSVLKWGLELAGVPVVPALVDFLAEIARRRADPAELPGLEAMMPGRPVAEWLSASTDAMPGDLRVVAGDIEGDSLLSWLKTLLADAFYWTDNETGRDIVCMGVNGAPAGPGIGVFGTGDNIGVKGSSEKGRGGVFTTGAPIAATASIQG
jgi:hypothetical protein